ncbi:hypothetical protein KIL84_010720 [Mauremys mutica]|uniref:Uncharacterized protein n=1 Tax=Mauremys mutica TaxID=74926 RepID=A0A9D3XC47_9SAUR|nr:hypothetical protein KIL84_010720 [Mauremys mutica]
MLRKLSALSKHITTVLTYQTVFVSWPPAFCSQEPRGSQFRIHIHNRTAWICFSHTCIPDILYSNDEESEGLLGWGIMEELSLTVFAGACPADLHCDNVRNRLGQLIVSEG